MEKLWVVCWGSAGSDDDGNAKAFTGVHGVYKSKELARKGLVECKDEIYDEIVNNPDFDENDVEEAKKTTRVYGSVNEDYFEIDYVLGDTPVEVYINLVEQEVK